MAPLQRRNTNLSIQGTVAVIILVVMFLGGIFCTIIFFKLCSKQRRRERAMRRMQEESAPFVTAQNTAPLGAPSDGNTPPYAEQTNGPTELHTAEYKSTAPLELQGEGRLEPLPAQQLDGYMAAVSPIVDGKFVLEMHKLMIYSQRLIIVVLSNCLRTLLWEKLEIMDMEFSQWKTRNRRKSRRLRVCMHYSNEYVRRSCNVAEVTANNHEQVTISRQI
jgi:hypothetical protein